MNSIENRKIFIIDDDESVCLMFEQVLTHIGSNNVHVFNSTIDAMKSLNEFEHPDFIFLDYLMPDMNGGQFLKWTTKTFPNNNIGFCVVSGCSELTKEEIGDANFLSKPFIIKDVEKILNDFFEKKNV